MEGLLAVSLHSQRLEARQGLLSEGKEAEQEKEEEEEERNWRVGVSKA